jgi:hypothetical protein
MMEPINSSGSIVRCVVNDLGSVPENRQDSPGGPPSLLDHPWAALEVEDYLLERRG